MSAHRILHALSISLVLLVTMCASASARADGLHIRVKGSAKIVARASRDQGDLILSGALSDDAGQPLAGEIDPAVVERRELQRRELYVAMTRAREKLWVGVA